ncbi:MULTISPECIES: type II toxin-antitoxin system PemK/MazF family toxin [unclassified Roseitalea]|uniref:type II toxin-antitoxin system PemK/MazF family toxin n=1 Tax=unclassified Roseitalea TaxID=2639107 RepID=UPI00273E8BEF|nr:MULTISPECIES: type II toxin-antitoxin system PemK/MazF family toxin [unclassified Roseitalea]
MGAYDGMAAQWDVVVVPFPYADRLAEKRRPALVVSSVAFHRTTGLMWVVMITSTSQHWPGDTEIADHAACGLPVPSRIRPAKIAAIEASRIVRVAGRIGRDEIAGVRAGLAAILGPAERSSGAIA